MIKIYLHTKMVSHKCFNVKPKKNCMQDRLALTGFYHLYYGGLFGAYVHENRCYIPGTANACALNLGSGYSRSSVQCALVHVCPFRHSNNLVYHQHEHGAQNELCVCVTSHFSKEKAYVSRFQSHQM